MMSYSICCHQGRWFYCIWAGIDTTEKPFSWGHTSSFAEALGMVFCICPPSAIRYLPEYARHWEKSLHSLAGMVPS